MNYETQYPIGNDQTARKETTTATAPPVGRLRKLDAKNQRHKRGAQRQTEIRTDNHVANGFLTCSFLPKLKTAQSVKACKKTANTETDVYKSLSKLAEHYSIQPMQSRQFEYPYNMALAIWDMQEKLKQRVLHWEEIRLVQDSQKTFFISEEKYGTGTTLYYIPVVPLFQMLNDPRRKKTAQLLVSVCSYLYHIADIPYYRQESSYLFWMYEMLTDWVEQDEETDETETYKSEIRQAELVGDRVEQKLFNRINLKVFEQRLNRFKSRDTFDQACQKVACDAFALYREYPSATIFRNAPIPEEDPLNDDYDTQTIGMEKYISFLADTRGWLYESLSETVNNEFNEYGGIEEPTLCKRFDGSDITKNNLDFENRLFALLEDLCSLLYDYKTTRK